jgi:hypothetical protein
MAAGAWKVYGEAVEALVEGGIDLDTDNFRMALVTSSYTPNQNTHATWVDVSTNEVANGNGYTTGGAAITVASSGNTNLVYTWDINDVSWPTSTITAKYAVIVRSANGTSLQSTDLLVCYCDLDTGGGSLSTTSGTFQVTISTSGVFTVTAS